MVEPIMFVGLGFLAASLLALVFIPIVHARAVRLTRQRIEASTPMSINEIQADKDQLRAEFAMSTRRLEMSVDQLRGKTTMQLADLGKKTEAIANMQAELAEKTATIFALEARDQALRDELLGTKGELGSTTGNLAETQSRLADRDAGLAKAISDLQERSALADSQSVELVARQAQLSMLQDRIATLEEEARVADGALQTLRTEKTLVDGQLERSRDDRARLQRELATLKREMEATWEQERSENALIRERINGVSAEVARLTMALEGADSPIETILAADAIGRPTNGNGAGGASSGRLSLADRIRALQSRTAQAAAG